MCVCIYQSNRSADIDQWCVWVCRKHRTACRECQWACNDPCVSASIRATEVQTSTNDVFESAENIEQPAENVNEPAMIPVCLHLSEQHNCRHGPMMCLSLQRTRTSLHRISKSLQWSMCDCIYQNKRTGDINQWCVGKGPIPFVTSIKVTLHNWCH